MTGESRWRTFTDVDAARGSILKRYSLRDVEVPDELCSSARSVSLANA